MRRTVSGRFPDIEVRKSSAWRTGSGRLPDLGRPGRSPVWEIAGFVMHPGAEKKPGTGEVCSIFVTMTNALQERIAIVGAKIDI